MKIAQIRRTIDACNWNRIDLSGATRDEFKAMDVPARLNRHIAAVRELAIPARFKHEIESQAWAIQCAEKTISRWMDAQGISSAVQ
jgi:hypothetical protein